MNKIKTSKEVLYLIIILLGISFSSALYQIYKSHQRNAELVGLYPIAQSQIEKIINSKGQLETKVQILETKNIKLLKQLRSNDSMVNRLKSQVEYYKNKLVSGSSVAVISNETNVSGTIENEEIEFIFDCDSTFPVYKSNVTSFGKWITGNIIASKNDTKLDLKIKNDLTVVIGEEKQGLFRHRKAVAIVTDENPYSEIKDMKVYKVSTKPRRTIRNIGIGLGIGIITGLLIN